MTSGPATNWPTVEAEVDRLIAEDEASFSAAAVANIHDFLGFVRTRCPVSEVASGCWRNSMRFSWAAVEVEVFEGRLELYRFYDRRTEIRHMPHIAGEPFPDDLVAELPVLPKG